MGGTQSSAVRDLFDLIKSNNVLQFSIYYEEIKNKCKHPTSVGLIIHDICMGCIRHHCLEICQLVLSDLLSIVECDSNTEPDILSNIDFSDYGITLLKMRVLN